MVAEELKTKEDFWGDIREDFIAGLAEVFCEDEHDPFKMIKAKERAEKIADRLIEVICERAGGRKLSIPHVPRCLRLVRNKQIVFDFDGVNHEQIGRAAPFLPVGPRQVRNILKLAKGG